MFYKELVRASLQHMKYRYSQWKITSIVNFFNKIMKFCILVVHDLTNDISYDAKLNRSNTCNF